MVPALITAALTALLPKVAEKAIGAAAEVVDRLVPDKNLAEKIKAEVAEKMADREFQNSMMQLQVNFEEAKSANWFVSGWRPAVGWIGAFSLGYAAIIDPLIRFVAMVVFGYKGPFPVLDNTITMQILFGILGLGAYRTYEKAKGSEGSR